MSAPIDLVINVRFQAQGVQQVRNALDGIIQRIERLRGLGVPIYALTQAFNVAGVAAVNVGQAFLQVLVRGAGLSDTLSRLATETGLSNQALLDLTMLALRVRTALTPIPARELAQEIARLAEQYNVSNDVMRTAFTTILEQEQGLDRLRGMIERVSRAKGRLSERYQTTRRYMQEFTGAMGVAGYLYMRIGYQIYWVSIGLIFYALSLRRVTIAQYQLEAASLAFLRSQYAIRDAEERLHETIARFGPTSREAQRAARDLALMRIQQGLQERRLRLLVEQTVTAQVTQYLTLIPIMINLGAIIMQMYSAYVALTAIQGIHTVQTKAGATSKGILATISGVLSGALGTEATQHGVNTAAIAAETAAQHALNIAKIIGIGIVTFGIGALVAWGATMAVTSWITAETNRRMEELNREIQSLNASVTGIMGSYGVYTEQTERLSEANRRLTESISDTEEELTGESLLDALLRTTNATRIFINTIRDLPEAIPPEIRLPQLIFPRVVQAEVTPPEVTIREIQPQIIPPDVVLPEVTVSPNVTVQPQVTVQPNVQVQPQITVPEITLPEVVLREVVVQPQVTLEALPIRQRPIIIVNFRFGRIEVRNMEDVQALVEQIDLRFQRSLREIGYA